MSKQEQQLIKALGDPLVDKLRKKYPDLFIIVVHKQMTVEEILKHLR